MFARMCLDALTLPTHDLGLISLARVATRFAEMSPVAPYEAYITS
jgi:hypothetical protein